MLAVGVAQTAITADGRQQVERQHHEHDDLAGLAQKEFHPVPGAQHHALDGRQMIGRQFHQQPRAVALEQRMLHRQTRENGHRDPGQIEHEHQILSRVRKESGSEQRIDRQPRPAGHEGIHQNRQLALALALQGARGHHRRHVAAETDDQRHERLARQPDRAHEAVHDEGRARHVARILQDREHDIETGDDGDEGADHLETAADARGQHQGQPVGRADPAQQLAEPVDEQRLPDLIEEVDEGPADVHGEHEHQIDHQQKQRDAERSAEHHLIDAIRDRALDTPLLAHHAPGECMGMAEAGVGDVQIGILARALGDLLAQ